MIGLVGMAVGVRYSYAARMDTVGGPRKKGPGQYVFNTSHKRQEPRFVSSKSILLILNSVEQSCVTLNSTLHNSTGSTDVVNLPRNCMASHVLHDSFVCTQITVEDRLSRRTLTSEQFCLPTTLALEADVLVDISLVDACICR
jgi:hypothetical protein